MRRIALMAAVVVVLCGVGQVDASIFEKDDAIFGPGSITLDTESGLEWLDIDIPGSRNYFKLKEELDSGIGLGQYEWRYARGDEWRELVENYFDFSPDVWVPKWGYWFTWVYPDYGYYDRRNFSEMDDFMEMFIHSGSVGTYLEGMIGEIAYSVGADVYTRTATLTNTDHDYFTVGNAKISEYIGGSSVEYQYQYPEYSHHWLVRDISTVPEPTTIIVWSLIGMTSICCWRRRR